MAQLFQMVLSIYLENANALVLGCHCNKILAVLGCRQMRKVGLRLSHWCELDPFSWWTFTLLVPFGLLYFLAYATRNMYRFKSLFLLKPGNIDY